MLAIITAYGHPFEGVFCVTQTPRTAYFDLIASSLPAACMIAHFACVKLGCLGSSAFATGGFPNVEWRGTRIISQKDERSHICGNFRDKIGIMNKMDNNNAPSKGWPLTPSCGLGGSANGRRVRRLGSFPFPGPNATDA